jgi:putative ABC transport system ATP-binding protein
MSNEILNILLGLNREDKATIVMVTHNQSMSERTERIVRLYDGSQVE